MLLIRVNTRIAFVYLFPLMSNRTNAILKEMLSIKEKLLHVLG